MADNDTPNRASNRDKAEGERWTSDEGVIPNSESSTNRRYKDGHDPVPIGEDVVNRYRHGHETPRRYDEWYEERDSAVDERSRS